MPKDDKMAGYYREDMNDDVVQFRHVIQQQIIKAIIEHCEAKSYILYYIATDPTHIHVLLGWRGFMKWEAVRRALKHSISKRLNEKFGKRQWLARGGSRKEVKQKPHFTYLIQTYLPSHRGLKWAKRSGSVQ